MKTAFLTIIFIMVPILSLARQEISGTAMMEGGKKFPVHAR